MTKRDLYKIRRKKKRGGGGGSKIIKPEYSGSRKKTNMHKTETDRQTDRQKLERGC